MTTTQELGHYGKQPGERCEYLALSFSPLSAPLRTRWRNNGVSADFMGDYVTTFLPANGGGNHQSEIRHAVTYIANEFLENAMKYHRRDADIPIGIRLELTSDQIIVSATNAISAEQSTRYKEFVDQILSEDPDELLIRQLEAGSSGAEFGSCMGLLTMITDYRAKLGWRFEAGPPETGRITVTTSAELSLGYLSGVEA